MNGRGYGKDRTGLAGAALCGLVMAATLLLGAGAASAAPGNGTGGAPAPAAEAGGKIDVNSASAAELASLPGIGASKAAAIIAEREKKPFGSVDDLERVRGIGARTVEDLRAKVSVGGR